MFPFSRIFCAYALMQTAYLHISSLAKPKLNTVEVEDCNETL